MSHETIYGSLFIQARGVLKKELVQNLRSKRLIRRSRHARAGGQSHGRIVDAISIRERPAEIEDRAIPVTRGSSRRFGRVREVLVLVAPGSHMYSIQTVCIPYVPTYPVLYPNIFLDEIAPFRTTSNRYFGRGVRLIDWV